jgi:hypothetical protein
MIKIKAGEKKNSFLYLKKKKKSKQTSSPPIERKGRGKESPKYL